MKTQISANSLFHFTSKLIYLENILKEGIYVRYSLEDYSKLIKGQNEICIPMACFCDIPLSQIKNHTNTYGTYAIGLTKEWGMKNLVSPVIYSYPDSITAKILNTIKDDLGDFFNLSEKEPQNKSLVDLLNNESTISNDVYSKIEKMQINISDFVRYIKPYEGKVFRGDNYLDKPIRFYDEREWRYTIPDSFFYDKPIKDSYKAEYYIHKTKRRAINMKLAKYTKLKFNPEDIRFIIVRADKEIPLMLEKMSKIKWPSASDSDLKILGTRLISLEQIIEDI